MPLRISLPSRPFCPAAPVAPSSPLSPFGPFRLPSRSHCPFFLTKMSPVVVLTYLSPSFPVSDVGSVVPLRMSLPSRPFCPFCPFCPAAPVAPATPSSPLSPFGPFRLPSRSHCPFFLTKMSPVVVLTYLSPSFPVSDIGSLVPLRMSLPSRPFCPFCPAAPATPSSPLSPFGPFRLPSRSHCPFFLTKMSPVVVLTYLSPSFPVSDVGSLVPLRISLPSCPFCPAAPVAPAAPSSPLSPFGPFRLPSRSHCPFFLTKMSPVVVLTYLSPSFPVSDVGSLVPLRMSLPSCPLFPSNPS